jgi:diguanylate cyclase (GGDEF)-like protein
MAAFCGNLRPEARLAFSRAMTKIAQGTSLEPDPLRDINLQLGRCLKTGFQHAAIELVALMVAVGLVFWLLSASDGFIGTKLLLIALILGTLVGHCYQMMRHHECGMLVLKQLEITAKDRAKTNRLYDLSMLDPLTSLHNRRFGEQSLKEAIERSGKTGDCLAIVLIDLDYFKEINDQCGHAVGDLALKEFSRSLRKAIRACDVPVRLGGDEFLLVLPECPRDKVSVILQRIGTPTIDCDGIKIHVCYSSGSAHFEYGDTAETLLARADEVLYAKKAARSAGPSKPAAQISNLPLRIGSELSNGEARTAEAIWRRS